MHVNVLSYICTFSECPEALFCWLFLFQGQLWWKYIWREHKVKVDQQDDFISNVSTWSLIKCSLVIKAPNPRSKWKSAWGIGHVTSHMTLHAAVARCQSGSLPKSPEEAKHLVVELQIKLVPALVSHKETGGCVRTHWSVHLNTCQSECGRGLCAVRATLKRIVSRTTYLIKRFTVTYDDVWTEALGRNVLLQLAAEILDGGLWQEHHRSDVRVRHLLEERGKGRAVTPCDRISDH